MKITFIGATETVTGSQYLVEHETKRILIDCGMFQGFSELRQRNWTPFTFDPQDIDAVLLTHAHIDHSGLIPRLIKQGYSGKIYSSEATYELCRILLPDSGYLHEEDAYRANKYGYSKHHPALPLYTKEEAEESLAYFKTVPFGKPIPLGEGLTFTLSRAGHILGSSIITLRNPDKTIVFTGDLGRQNNTIMKLPAQIQDADYLVLDSTYGNKLHDAQDPMEEIGDIIKKTAARGGTIVIPAFAVGRAQSILYYIYMLKKQQKIPNLPVFLDSPMAVNTTKLLCQFMNDHQLSETVCEDVCSVAQYVNSVDDSKALDQQTIPKIIISASGMATGGRVLHHLKYFMVDPKNTILFTGFQAKGTRGDRMLNQEREIRIFGEMYPLNAEVHNISSLSAHADYEEILTWLSNFKRPPRTVFLTHGEPESALALKQKIEEKYGWNVVVPSYLQHIDLE